LEVSGAVRALYESLGVKGLKNPLHRYSSWYQVTDRQTDRRTDMIATKDVLSYAGRNSFSYIKV